MSVDDLHRFSAGSANDDKFKDFWIKGASMYIDQLNSLLKYTRYLRNITDINVFNNPESDNLGKILTKNRSDKASNHNYNIVYSYIFNQLGCNNKLKILEIGLGTNNPSLVSSMGKDGRPGASLYSWEEYLPNSEIYGADIDKDILFTTDRIKTHAVDQLDSNSFLTMQTAFDNPKYDLIIDDGLHSIGANLNTLLFALENINSDGWIVIEDILSKYVDNWYAVDSILLQNKNYECFIVKSKIAYLYVVHKL